MMRTVFDKNIGINLESLCKKVLRENLFGRFSEIMDCMHHASSFVSCNECPCQDVISPGTVAQCCSIRLK